MSWVQIHPGYRPLFEHCGLREAGDFLRLSGVILCGHADRHVQYVNLEPDDGSFGMFLKREHRIPWRQRLASFRAGFGFVSRSAREARLLELLRQAGVGCPEVLAVGEEGGRAFLLLREQKDAIDLRAFLVDHRQRRELACALGAALARMHAAGFSHPELFAKHVLVSTDPERRFCLLDWQRAAAPHVLSEKERLGDLGALDASLSSTLASRTDRLACLRSYLQQLAPSEVGTWAHVVAAIRAASERLRRTFRIREQLQPTLPRGQQNLIWLDGERLCVTRHLRQRHPELVAELQQRVREPMPTGPEAEQVQFLSLPHRSLTLIRRRTSRFTAWLAACCRRRVFVSPDFEQAATIFRLERHGIRPPRLLAVGQEFSLPWSSVSFLLTETPDADLALTRFLEWAHCRDRWELLRQTGRLLRRLHEAGYLVSSFADWAVQGQGPRAFQVVLAGVGGLVRSRRGFERNLRRLGAELRSCGSRTDLLRFVRAYDGETSSHSERRQPTERRLSA